ncbi:mycofactocin biosynthesis peptidyl-dipeptidase MftE [Nocardioides sp. Bht2]|uniref:mycofactocin biosynthesis peptidyl-dipeptidase MftE n=1 Tax=Nocardioides sp. Bht2 TaxID=3392297 RepID=UPI0039B634F9
MSAVLHLDGARWTDVPAGALVLVPVGSVEQHGPHLPLATDAAIAAEVTRQAAELVAAERAAELGPVVVAPVLPYGASGEHQGFAGTMSIGTDALSLVLIELARSLKLWAGSVVFINGHGGNIPALTRAVVQLVAEGHDAAWVPCASGHVDAHAGQTETSLMLHLAPEQVAMAEAEPGNLRPIEELMPQLMKNGVIGVSANGVLGDPTQADAVTGQGLWRGLIDDVAGRVIGRQRDARGCLTSPSREGAVGQLVETE